MSDVQMVTDGVLESLKSQHIGSVDPMAQELVLQSPSATLTMRPGGNEYRKIPHILARVSSLGKTALAAGQGMLEGKSLIAPDAMIENRLSICKACPYGGGDVFCRSCGCITGAKVRLSASHCPEGKWRSL